MAIHTDIDIETAIKILVPIEFRRAWDVVPQRRPLPPFEGPIADAMVRLRLEHASLRVDFLDQRPVGELGTDGKFILKTGPLGIEPWVEVYCDAPQVIQLMTLVHEIAHFRDYRTAGLAHFRSRTTKEAEVAAYHIGREMIASRPYLSRYISPVAWRRLHESVLGGPEVWPGTLAEFYGHVLGEG